MSVNRWSWSDKVVRRAIRFLTGEIKVAPRALNQLGVALFKTADDKLFFKDGKSWKEVIPEGRVDELITQFDADPRYSGGRDRLYGHMTDQFVGITRKSVMAFIKSSAVHQITQPRKRKVQSRPIVITRPGIYAQVDLVDMQKQAGLNNGFHWILTYVDLFSKYARAIPLKSKHVPKVIKAMHDMFGSMPASYRPRTIQSDRGSEFLSRFEKAMKDTYNIRVVHSQAYNPSSQGAVERFNLTLKRMIYQSQTRFDSKRWIDILDSIIANYNNTKHSTTLRKPIDVMRGMKDKALVAEIYARLQKKALKRLEKYGDAGEEYSVGDTVRVALTSESKARKNQFAKRAGANWSADLYVVRSKSSPTELYNKPQYLLSKGKRDLKKKYWAYQMIKVDPNRIVADLQPTKDRPVYDKKLFNNEAHIKTGAIRNIQVKTMLPQKTALQERKTRPKRKRRPPKRLEL